jgi:hypothetical protein
VSVKATVLTSSGVNVAVGNVQSRSTPSVTGTRMAVRFVPQRRDMRQRIRHVENQLRVFGRAV